MAHGQSDLKLSSTNNSRAEIYIIFKSVKN